MILSGVTLIFIGAVLVFSSNPIAMFFGFFLVFFGARTIANASL